ncbi:MAG: regulator, partial [Clostridia bacterium]|nr:regulator [Clostridia bacterium]
MRTIHTDTAPAALGPYSQAKATCKLIFTSGQIAIDPAEGKIVDTTIEGQTHQVCKNLGEVPKAAGTDFD